MTIDELAAYMASEFAWLNGISILTLIIVAAAFGYLVWRVHQQQLMIDELETRIYRTIRRRKIQ